MGDQLILLIQEITLKVQSVLVQFETPTLADYLILKLLKSRTFMIVAIDNLKNRKLSNALQIVYDYSETICGLWIPPNIELHR
jgi:hypothetical protein